MRSPRKLFAFLMLAGVLSGCAAGTAALRSPRSEDASAMNRIAESYVKLVLAVGQHDPDYVDAYYGPPEWRTEAEGRGKRPLAEIRSEAAALLSDLQGVSPDASGPDAEMVRLRHEFLNRQLQSLAARVDQLDGKKLTFDEESKALYDAVSPRHDAAYYQAIVDRLDAALPGDGPMAEQVDRFWKDFVVPQDRLESVFKAAVDECRQRTAPHIELPANESFELEFVTGKPWSGYNWYKGNFHSLIQLNTSLPVFIDRAVDLACHEGYPGHHVYNALLERHLVRDRGWREFSVYPLNSPQSLIGEGTANFGIQVAFPGPERIEWEKRVLFPLAGLDPARAERYYEVLALARSLTYAGNDAARGYLDGEMTREQAIDWLMKYALFSRERAEQRVRFFDQYRSYVINYNLGQDMVKEYVERQGGTADNPQKRWEIFRELLSSPRLPSGLR